MAEDFSRCFPVPSLPAASGPNAGRLLSFESAIAHLSSNCWSHYEEQRSVGCCSPVVAGCHQHSLYIGSLGPCAFVRYRLAQSLSWADEKETKRRLLHDASQAADAVLDSQPAGRRMTVTLLEGERTGALALSAAINYSLQAVENDDATLKASRAKKELLDIGTRYVEKLPESECEVLYGRAGYLQAIAFVRSETNDNDFGNTMVQHIVKSILKEGERVANANESAANSLLWEWHGKKYLGAIHGVAGILFTLLCFHEEVSLIDNSLSKIKTTITKLSELCSASGNLKSSLGTERDKLVHLCHGAPGHILLLVKAYEVLNDQEYLESAEEIARNVICRRGLLKKGVGLCHGISGNAYCFLAIYRGRRLSEQRTGGSSNLKSSEWLRWAFHFANFAVDNLNDLFYVPDHPCSLYEGGPGLIMLLHDLKDPDHSSFPCFEPRM
ncbi:hypothetical protein ACHAXR_004498 [Thalassiosira sp. AJA248-18]